MGPTAAAASRHSSASFGAVFRRRGVPESGALLEAVFRRERRASYDPYCCLSRNERSVFGITRGCVSAGENEAVVGEREEIAADGRDGYEEAATNHPYEAQDEDAEVEAGDCKPAEEDKGGAREEEEREEEECPH